jgi:predicted TIM-barrel fold metal-dependent hydrolase
MIIDSHAHMGPAILHAGRKMPVKAVTAEETVEMMDASGIDISVIFAPLWKHGPYNDPDYYLGNYVIAETCRLYPDRFVGYGRVNPNRAGAAIREFRHCVEDYKLKGLMLHPEWESFQPDDQSIMWPLAEMCAEYGLPLSFHTGYYPTCQPMLFVALAEAFPTVPIYFKHIGYEYWRDAVLMAKRYPNCFVETAANSTCGEIYAAIRYAGADKVCYGSDFPYIDPRVVIKKVEALPISDEEKALVFYKNTAKINKLDLDARGAAKSGAKS